MQTLKTVIIVLLMMVVIYGSYVSLTTPPEPLPDAVAELIQDSGSFELQIDEGLPESLNDLAVDSAAAPATGGLAAPDLAVAPDHSPDPAGEAIPPLDKLPGEMPSASSTAISGLNSPSNSTPVTSSLTDKTATSTPIGGSSPKDSATMGSSSSSSVALASPSLSSPVDGSLSDVIGQLPKPDEQAAAPEIDRTKIYPSTGTSAMTLPDPSSLSNSADSSWNKDATPVSFALPNKDEPVTAKLTDSDHSPSSSGPVGGMVLPDSLDGAPGDAPSSTEPNQGLANAIRNADRQFAADQPLDALMTLSLFYDTPNLSTSDRQALISRLDPLAGIVIYSRRHLLEQPYRVGPQETLMEIAARLEIPWQLLANINGIQDPVAVLPGTELKVVRGPFRADVDVTRKELTIYLRDLYAGRFPIELGADPAPEPGSYTVQEKQTARTFYDRNGSPVPPGDARNPYGNVWMDLGKQFCIHGSPDRNQASTGGCISLRGVDADDLYGILSQGSSVTIRR